MLKDDVTCRHPLYNYSTQLVIEALGASLGLDHGAMHNGESVPVNVCTAHDGGNRHNDAVAIKPAFGVKAAAVANTATPATS
ncbi:hypothetical protein [Mesorhizobium sp. SARCC-RB16n]|uniref:hypothetical protein n=1 Tax=Mesorhizobium sp. SARCC-RB16n TaxID=2116687 RepID=UPI00122F926B|nr:hypothetical protein [Mesorhizobium sp. SARCC-RB16n]